MQRDHGCENVMSSGTQNSRAPLRVGLLLHDQVSPRWIHETIVHLLSAEHVELVVIIFDGGEHGHRHSLLFRLWTTVDRWLFGKQLDLLARERKTYPVPTIILPARTGNRKCVTPDGEIEKVRAFNLDILVKLGSCDLPGTIVTCAKYGMWGFLYNGYTNAEADVALFYNLNAGRSTYELTLLAETRSQPRVLYRSTLHSDLFSLHRTLIVDCRRRSQILLQSIWELYQHGWPKVITGSADEDIVKAPVQTASVSGIMPEFITSWFVRSLGRLCRRICFREQWVLAYCKACSGANMAQRRWGPLTIVAPSRGQNYADPFLFERCGQTYVFFEQFADNRPGTILCAQLYGNGTLGEIQQVLAKDYHLSYPFVFEWRGDTYLLPESFDNRTVEVYVSIDFPQRWELATVLLRNVTAADPTIVEHNGKLWLFVSGLGGAETEFSELYLFFADSLFGEWRPHPLNPIVRDVRRARPAGRLFFEGDHLIRPGQDCSKCYGHSISLNRVDVLTETDFMETPLRTILPNWLPRVSATHTFNQGGDFTVLDGMVLVHRWSPSRWKPRALQPIFATAV